MIVFQLSQESSLLRAGSVFCLMGLARRNGSSQWKKRSRLGRVLGDWDSDAFQVDRQ